MPRDAEEEVTNGEDAELDVDVESVEGTEVDSPPEPSTREALREETATHIGKMIVWAFAGSIALCFAVTLIQIFRAESGKADMTPALELFKTTSAVLSGPLGFVLGFYFRERRSD
jgi:hypothetical protein